MQSGQEVPNDRREAEWSFDLTEMKRHLDEPDDLQVTVRAHLYVEHILVELLKLSLKNPQYVLFDRLPFVTKLEICAGLGALDPSLLAPIKRLNSLRNAVSHNLNYRLTEDDKNKLFDSFNKQGRDLILESGVDGISAFLPDVRFGRIFKVIVILLDLGRQRYLEWVRQREAAFKNARDLLDELGHIDTQEAQEAN